MSRKKLLKNNQNKNAIKYSINDITVWQKHCSFYKKLISF
jgi:hypothetical protein